MSLERVALLSERQLEILRLAQAREKSEIIAGKLGLSPHTVNSYTSAALKKLGVTSRFQASLLVREWDEQPQEIRDLHSERARSATQAELVSELMYQSHPVASKDRSPDQIIPAVALEGDRQAGGRYLLREDRAAFHHMSPRFSSTHPSLSQWISAWSSDNDLPVASKFSLILKVVAAVLVVALLCMLGLDTLQRLLIERGFTN